MRRDGDGFDLEEMMRILGGTEPGAAPAASGAAGFAQAAPVVAEAPALTPEEQALLDDYEAGRSRRRQEERLLRVREQIAVREQEARRIIEDYGRQAVAESVPSAPAPSAGGGLGDIGQAENAAFCALLEGSRVVLFSYLAPRIGSKNAVAMLNKSFEKARSKVPAVFKDANWRPDGSLREDGSVDPERLLRNAAGLPPEGRVDGYLAGLRELLDLRLKAVEAGLGAQVRGEVAARLRATREDPANRAVPGHLLAAFYDRVLA